MTLGRLAECAIDKKAIIETLRETYAAFREDDIPYQRLGIPVLQD